MSAPRRSSITGPSLGTITMVPARVPGRKVGGGAAQKAFADAHKEIGEKLQEVGFRRVNNTLKKSRAAGRSKVQLKGDNRTGRGLRAALRDSEFHQPSSKGWEYGVVIGNQAVIDRHRVKDYWRTIESGGGPVGKWFPNYLLNLQGRPVSSSGAQEADARRVPAGQRKALLRRAQASGSDSQLNKIVGQFKAEDRAYYKVAGRAQKNWAASGAVMAEGVAGVNRLGGVRRGSIKGGQRTGESNRTGFFQVKKRIEGVRYMALMEDTLRRWAADGTLEEIYRRHLREAGLDLNLTKNFRVSGIANPDNFGRRMLERIGGL